MPQIVLAGAVLAAAWLAGRLMRRAFSARPADRQKMRRDTGEEIIPLRRDPETGVYIPAERD